MATAPPATTTGLGGLSPDITNQFLTQMKMERDRTTDALSGRDSALQAYQEAIRNAPNARTPADAFGAIGEGTFANPNFAWNPSAALASGFQRMNQVQDLRRQQMQEAPVQAAQVGYENAKDLSDKMLTKDILTPASMISYLNRTNTVQSANARQMTQQRAALFKINLDAAIAAHDPNAHDTATRLTDSMWEEAQAKPAAKLLQKWTGIADESPAVPPPPPAGAPSTGLGALSAAGGNAAVYARAIMADQAANPPKPDASGVMPPPARYALNTQTPLPVGPNGEVGAPNATGMVPPPPAQGAAGVPPPPVPGTPGLSFDEVQRRAGELEKAKAGAADVAKSAGLGLKYYEEIGDEAEVANNQKRVLNAVNNNLEKLAQSKQVGTFAGLNKVVSTLKVALDPDGSKGWATPTDISNAAELEATDKENFQLGVGAAKGLSSRATQMEFMKALENNPIAFMSSEGRKKIMGLLNNTVDDVLDQHKDLQDYMAKNGVANLYNATPAQQASLLQHKNGYIQYQSQRNAGRSVEDQYSDPQHPERGLSVPYGGEGSKDGQITVHPYWSNKYRALVAKYPDGVHVIQTRNSEE